MRNPFLTWATVIVFVVLGCIGEPDIELILQDPQEFDRPLDHCESDLCVSLVELIDQAEVSIDFAVYGARMQSAILEALLGARNRGVVLRGYVDKDTQNKNYYSSTNVWEREIGNIRDDFARELECFEEFTGLSPCEQVRPSGFEGPLQCLAYELGEGRILVAGHAARESFAAASIMHNKFSFENQSSTHTSAILQNV